MGRELEDLDLGVVRGEQHLAVAVTVEVGEERRSTSCLIVNLSSDRWYHASRNEKSPSCCRRRRGMGQLGFQIESERGGGGELTWSEKKTTKVARRRMLRSRFR